MSVIFARAVILYLLVSLAVRIMGKREVSELQASELVAMLIVSEVASIPVQTPELPLIGGIMPVFVIASLEIVISYIMARNKKARRFLIGKPSIIVHNGVVNDRELRRLRLSRDDLFEELRQEGCVNILQVRYGIVETNGKFSLVLKKDEQPATFKDVKDSEYFLNQNIESGTAQKKNESKAKKAKGGKK